MAAAVILGTLTAMPAQAGSGLIKVTHSDGYWKSVQPAIASPVKSRPAVRQAVPVEMQVAIMVSAPSSPAPRRSVYIHR